MKHRYPLLLAVAAALTAGCAETEADLRNSCVDSFREIAEGDLMRRYDRGASTLVFQLNDKTDEFRTRLYRDWGITRSPAQLIVPESADRIAARLRFLARNQPVPELLLSNEYLIRVAGPSGTGEEIVQRSCALQRRGASLEQIAVTANGPEGSETFRQIVP